MKFILNWEHKGKTIKYQISDIIKKYRREARTYEARKKQFNKMLWEMRNALSTAMENCAQFYRIKSKKVVENALEKLLSFYQISINILPGKGLLGWERDYLDPIKNEVDLINYLGEMRFGDELRDVTFNPGDAFDPYAGNSYHFGKSYNGQAPGSIFAATKPYRGSPDKNELPFLRLSGESQTLLGKLKVSDIIGKKTGKPMTFVNLTHCAVLPEEGEVLTPLPLLKSPPKITYESSPEIPPEVAPPEVVTSTPKTKKTASFKKLKDNTWGIIIEGIASSGERVTVKKRSGETSEEIVGKVIWTGPDKYTGKDSTLATIQKSGGGGGRSGGGGGRSDSSGTCDECGSYSRTLIPATDMSGIPGMVCPTCKNSGYLSFA